MRISDWSSDVCSSDLELAVSVDAQLAHGICLVAAHGLDAAADALRDLRHRQPLRQQPDHLALAFGQRRDHGLAHKIAHMGAQVWLAGNSAAHCDQRSEEHTSELQSLMRLSYAVFCLKKKQHDTTLLAT